MERFLKNLIHYASSFAIVLITLYLIGFHTYVWTMVHTMDVYNYLEVILLGFCIRECTDKFFASRGK